MITIRLIGGLGNQMFQYALGRKLSLANNTALTLDISGLAKNSGITGYTVRNYDLNAFNIPASIVADPEFKPEQPAIPFVSKVLNVITPYYKRKNIQEKDFSFDPEIVKVRKGYLDGYWQSARYFEDVRPTLLNDFTLRNPLSEHAQEYAKQIKERESVFVHIRRGDYVSSYSDHYHIMDIPYYQKGIEHIQNYYSDLSLFVFSDDISWAQQNLKTDFPTVFVNATKNYEDIHLMSLCKHGIMANSSFSWWGAWLINNDNKIIVAPEKWFKKPINTSDLIPATYVKL